MQDGIFILPKEPLQFLPAKQNNFLIQPLIFLDENFYIKSFSLSARAIRKTAPIRIGQTICISRGPHVMNKKAASTAGSA